MYEHMNKSKLDKKRLRKKQISFFFTSFETSRKQEKDYKREDLWQTSMND
jgi:hypothetical protein